MLLVLRQQSVNNFVQDSCETSSAAARVTSDQEQTETLARMDGEMEDMREKKKNPTEDPVLFSSTNWRLFALCASENIFCAAEG